MVIKGVRTILRGVQLLMRDCLLFMLHFVVGTIMYGYNTVLLLLLLLLLQACGLHNQVVTKSHALNIISLMTECLQN